MLVRRLLLVVLLLLAQQASLSHREDMEAHVAGDSCEVCLHASALDDGIPGVVLEAPARSLESEAPADATVAPISGRKPSAPNARSPPSPLRA